MRPLPRLSIPKIRTGRPHTHLPGGQTGIGQPDALLPCDQTRTGQMDALLPCDQMITGRPNVLKPDDQTITGQKHALLHYDQMITGHPGVWKPGDQTITGKKCLFLPSDGMWTTSKLRSWLAMSALKNRQQHPRLTITWRLPSLLWRCLWRWTGAMFYPFLGTSALRAAITFRGGIEVRAVHCVET